MLCCAVSLYKDTDKNALLLEHRLTCSPTPAVFSLANYLLRQRMAPDDAHIVVPAAFAASNFGFNAINAVGSTNSVDSTTFLPFSSI